MKIHYIKTQYGILLSAIMLLMMIFLSYAYFAQLGSKPIPMFVYILIMLLFVTCILLFYKLTIIIDDNKISAILGIGILKKSFAFKEIERIEKYTISWYTGIGIRLTTEGWLWNVKVGNAILLKNKNTTFLVGSDDVETIIKTINQLNK